MGGFRGINSGTTQNGPRTRALLRFDLTSLPTNTVIQSAVLTVQVTQQPVDGYDFTVFGLHRMFKPWGEGNKVPQQFPGQGVPATAGEATWLCSFFSTNAWGAPGGSAGVDYDPAQSSFETIYDVANSPYIFPSTPELVDDVSLWVSRPASNFGWMLLCGDESLRFTARRFGSREDADNPPVLELKYLVPPVLQIHRTNSHQVAIRFTAWAGHSYTIQTRTSANAGVWKTLKTLPAAPTNHTAVILDYALDDLKHAPYRTYRQRYYRATVQ